MLKELDVIIETCSKGKQISNFQIRSIITSLAANLKQVAVKNNNVGNDKKVQHTSDEQLIQMKSQLNKKFQYLASQSIPKYIKQQIAQLEKKVQEYLTQERKYVISMEQKLQKIDKKPENSNRLIEKQLTKKIQQQVTKLKNYLDQQLKKITINPINQSLTQTNLMQNQQLDFSKRIQQQNYYNSTPLLFPNFITNRNAISNPIQSFNLLLQQAQQTQQSQATVNAILWVDSSCRSYKNIVFDKKNLSDLSVQRETLIFGRQRITNKYQIIFLNKKSAAGQIGISDASYKQMLNLQSLPNKACYLSIGYCDLGSSSEKVPGGGYQQGEIITMNVDVKAGSISWTVGSSVKFQKCFEKIKDSSIVWVPIIKMNFFQTIKIKQSKYY